MTSTIEMIEVVRTKAGPRVGRILGILGAVGVFAVSPSCVNVTQGGEGECQTNADCSDNADGKTQCSADNVCVSAPPAVECTTNQQCLDMDPNKICRKSDNTCVPLRTPECDVVDGDPARDDSLLIGAILPTTGPDEIYGKPTELAIQLALSEIQDKFGGIPTGSPGVTRPILFVGCSDNTSDTDTAIAAATHLSEVLEVPAIIGEAFSGLTLAIASEVTIKNGTLLISPSATNDAITNLPDNDLVWRTSPPDSLQSAALKLHVPEVETIVRADFVVNQMPLDTPVKVAILHNTDSYGVAMADGMLASTSTPPLQINGAAVNDPSNMASYVRKQYSYIDIIEQVDVATQMAETFHPNIVLLLGFSEVTSIMLTIEEKWTGDPNLRPRYVFADAALGGDLYAAIDTNDALRKRITGTVPGTTSQPFMGFVDRYNLKYPTKKDSYPATIFGAAGGYDAVYLLALASASLNGNPETGNSLAMGLKKLSNPDGLLVNPIANNFPVGVDLLTGNQSINYDGASGPLDFDPSTGEAPSDIQIWCLPAVAGGAGSFTSSGRFYDAATAQLAGSFTACN
jgi:hypothetical protein